MAKLIPFARKTCTLETPLNLQRGIFSVGYLLAIKTCSSCRDFSSKSDSDEIRKNTTDSKSLTSSQTTSGGEIQTTFTKVKETTKTASYLGVIVAGIGVTAIIFYTVLKELFSSKSPSSVYSAALERCRDDPRIQTALGMPIKGFGEETRRGRRRHVSHFLYNKDGVNHLRMKFYIEGIRKKATVHLEMKEDESGSYIYRYLFVELDDFGRHAIVLEDNRFGHVDPPKGRKIEELDLSQELENQNF